MVHRLAKILLGVVGYSVVQIGIVYLCANYITRKRVEVELEKKREEKTIDKSGSQCLRVLEAKVEKMQHRLERLRRRRSCTESQHSDESLDTKANHAQQQDEKEADENLLPEALAVTPRRQQLHLENTNQIIMQLATENAKGSLLPTAV